MFTNDCSEETDTVHGYASSGELYYFEVFKIDLVSVYRGSRNTGL